MTSYPMRIISLTVLDNIAYIRYQRVLGYPLGSFRHGVDYYDEPMGNFGAWLPKGEHRTLS